MKNIKKAAITLLAILTLASCASPQKSPTPVTDPSVSASPEAVAHYNPMSFSSKEDFYDAVIDAKASKNSGDAQTSMAAYYKLEEITSYVDLKKIVKEIELREVRVKPVYVVLDYRKKEEPDESALVIQWDRGAYGDDYDYIEWARTKGTTNHIEIRHNGNIVIKDEVYHNYAHACNQYFWEESGYNVFLRVPAWLLELYPEETFFDIQVVTVPTEKAGDGLSK